MLPIKAGDCNVSYLNLIKQPSIVVTVVIVTFKALKPIRFQLTILLHIPSFFVKPKTGLFTLADPDLELRVGDSFCFCFFSQNKGGGSKSAPDNTAQRKKSCGGAVASWLVRSTPDRVVQV